MRISVIGLGIIGSAWARRYEEARVLAATWNRSPKPDAPRWVPTVAEAARAGDIVQIVIADPPAIDEVLGAILPAIGPGKTIVQSSTIDPDSSDRFRTAVTGAGARYVEAPFTGSKPAAEAGKTIYYLGADPADLDAVEAVLSRVSEHRFRVGTNRQAAALKLSMNMQIAGLMEALAEGLAFARKAGIADDLFFHALEHNVAHSGLVRLKKAKLLAADYSPQFSVKHLLKDLRLALGEEGAAYPVARAVRDRLIQATERGWADEDFSVIAKLPPAFGSVVRLPPDLHDLVAGAQVGSKTDHELL